MKKRIAWGVLWRSENRIDGKREYLVGKPTCPFRTALFETRHEARSFIKDKYGCIAKRKDLRIEPHGWRVPVPVKVVLKIKRAAA